MQQTIKLNCQAISIALFAALAWSAPAVHAEDKKPEAFVFASLDTNGDGVVSKEEAEGKIAPEVVKTADKNGDGKLDPVEFQAAGLDKAR
ncbi:MAG: hypothetical protein PHS77_13075 [Gallionellaceae bacterium]|nr:hypothetical protein [Gallionellaceae bacterium]